MCVLFLLFECLLFIDELRRSFCCFLPTIHIVFTVAYLLLVVRKAISESNTYAKCCVVLGNVTAFPLLLIESMQNPSLDESSAYSEVQIYCKGRTITSSQIWEQLFHYLKLFCS